MLSSAVTNQEVVRAKTLGEENKESVIKVVAGVQEQYSVLESKVQELEQSIQNVKVPNQMIDTEVIRKK